jgi:hypothetical protein
MVRGRIVYAATGKRYFVDDREVTQASYDRTFPSKLDAMLAASRPPCCMTDSVFLEGHCNGSQFAATPAIGDFYAQEARRHGLTDTKGKVYLSGLAAFPGDPEAWVSGRDDVRRVLEQRGWDGEGAVNVKAFQPKERPPVSVADDILEEEVQGLLDDHPEPQTVNRGELKEQVRQKRKPHWAS